MPPAHVWVSERWSRQADKRTRARSWAALSGQRRQDGSGRGAGVTLAPLQVHSGPVSMAQGPMVAPRAVETLGPDAGLPAALTHSVTITVFPTAPGRTNILQGQVSVPRSGTELGDPAVCHWTTPGDLLWVPAGRAAREAGRMRAVPGQPRCPSGGLSVPCPLAGPAASTPPSALLTQDKLWGPGSSVWSGVCCQARRGRGSAYTLPAALRPCPGASRSRAGTPISSPGRARV